MAAGTTGASTAPAASFVAIIIWIFPSLPLSLSLCDAAYTSPPLRLPSTDNYPRGLFLPARYYISPVFGRPPAVSITRASGRFDPAFSNQIEWGGGGGEKKNSVIFSQSQSDKCFRKRNKTKMRRKKNGPWLRFELAVGTCWWDLTLGTVKRKVPHNNKKKRPTSLPSVQVVTRNRP